MILKTMRSLFALTALCVAVSSWAAPVTVESVRIWAAPDSTRVVFDVSGPVEHQTTLYPDPFRLVVDIKDTGLPDQFTQPTSQDKYLQRLRGARRNQNDLRVVLDLKKYSHSRSFQLKPNQHYGHRLVVDIFDTETEEQADEDPQGREMPVNSMRDLVIAIDAGHGGEDPGARGPMGTLEKDIVLKLATELAAMINREHGMRAVLIREGDYFMRLRKRIKKARKVKADMFISIHADAFKDPEVHGSSVYVLSRQGASSEHARWLAEQENASDLIGGVSLEDKDDILASVLLDLSQTASLEASIDIADRVFSSLKRIGNSRRKKIGAAGFAVLKSPDIPSILVETAFISNPAEEKKLRSVKHQRKIAGAILTGVKGYFQDNAMPGTQLATRKHVITRGDTLSTIAQHYQVSLNILRDMNGLKGDLLHVGKTLTIPSGRGG